MPTYLNAGCILDHSNIVGGPSLPGIDLPLAEIPPSNTSRKCGSRRGDVFEEFQEVRHRPSGSSSKTVRQAVPLLRTIMKFLHALIPDRQPSRSVSIPRSPHRITTRTHLMCTRQANDWRRQPTRPLHLPHQRILPESLSSGRTDRHRRRRRIRLIIVVYAGAFEKRRGVAGGHDGWRRGVWSCGRTRDVAR